MPDERIGWKLGLSCIQADAGVFLRGIAPKPRAGPIATAFDDIAYSFVQGMERLL